MADMTTGGELRIERVFDAPRETIFDAWLDPDQLSRWYGPAHMESPLDLIKVEPEVGGRWEVVMVQGDRRMPLGATIVELVRPELIVLENDALPEHGMGVTRTRVELHDEDGKTRMLLVDGPYEGNMGDMAGQGWGAAFDKLAAALTG